MPSPTSLPSHWSRRQLLRAAASVPVAAASTRLLAQTSPAATRPAAADGEAIAHWLGDPPTRHAGCTFGVAWPEGEHAADQAFNALDTTGASVPVQTWPTAYWPDGSLKWTAHALPPREQVPDMLKLVPADHAAAADVKLSVDEGDSVTIDTGPMKCTLGRSGSQLIESIERGDGSVLRNGRLVCVNQNASDSLEANNNFSVAAFMSDIEHVTVEQAGPLRAVVKVEGKHSDGKRSWLPFVVRLYFYAGSDHVRLMHTIIYDGNEQHDFIRGLGVRFDVPMKDALHDRHVRFTNQDRGLFAEGVRGLTGLRRDPGEEVRQAQIEGRATPPISDWSPAVGDRVELIPAFGDYTLAQLSADGFQIRKRTKPGHGWIDSAAGERANGSGFVGGPSGGVAFGLRNFWQSHPTQLDIRHAHEEAAEVTVWMWSPDAKAMDLRFYHDGLGMDTYEKQLEGLNITYEDYEPGFGTPVGIARTSELFLWACDATPSREALADFGEIVAEPPTLACAPEQLVKAGVFGELFSLPDRSTARKAELEDQLDYLFQYYLDQRENQRWYGYWNYGDVMHTYDGDRHTWRYDVGGYAWDNSELSPDLWLWYSFLRTGRNDIFRFAEAMTRHTGEVDVYHLGRFKRFGTRHNVQHWGCSAKQMRISTAIYRRFYYYLTADERTGDLLRELLDLPQAATTLDPVRKVREDVFDPQPEALSLGLGTDYSAVCAAWLTEWERTGDDKWRDKIVAGLESIGELANGYFTPVTFDMNTDRFNAYGEPGRIDVSHLSAVFGLVEVNAELIRLLDVPKFKQAWLQYCILYNATPEEQVAALGEPLRRLNLQDHHSRLTAYAAKQLDRPDLAERAWREFGVSGESLSRGRFEKQLVDGPEVLKPIEEDPQVSTNWASQYGLSVIENLALAPEALERVD